MSSVKKVDVVQKKYSYLEFLRDLFVFLKPYRSRLAIASSFRFVGDLAGLVPPFVLASIVTLLSDGIAINETQLIWIWIAILSAALTIRMLAQYSNRMIGFRVAEQAALDAQLMAITHLMKLDMTWHELENAGNKLKKITRGAESIIKLVRIWLGNLIEIGVNFVGVIIIIATQDVFVATCFLLYTLTFYIVVKRLMQRARLAAEAVNVHEENLSGLIFETLNNIRTTKVLGMGRAVTGLLKTLSSEVMARVRSRISAFQIRNLVAEIYTNSFRVGGVIFILYGILHGRYEVGFLLLFNGYLNRVSESVNELSEVSLEIIVGKTAIRRISDLLRQPLGSDDDKGKHELSDDWSVITVKDLSFWYGSAQVLNNVSFEIKRGEKVGIVGLSGAGKSTLFKLLLKENEDYEGDIYIDSMSLKKIKKTSYYKHATVVLQDTEVFNFSLRDNITLSNVKSIKDEKALKKALDTAHVTDFVKRLPEGVDTLIGEKGIKLSGGERQRLGIARAIYKQPDILFLDEATSHLDLESEEKIQDSLHKFFQGVTAVVIAHRLTTIKEMDKIIVLEHGKLIESGSFAELYDNHGRFFELWEKQKLDH